MKRNLGPSLVLSALLLVTIGCGGEPGGITGKWTIDTAAMKESILGDRTAGMSDEQKKEMADNPMIKTLLEMFDDMNMEMELKADGTCSSSARMRGKSDSSTGTWKQDGDVVAITMKSMMEENAKDETQKFKVKGDKLVVILGEEEKKAGMPAFVFIRK